ncbi:VCBS repeat-containing protein [bacterium]|nr:VCBS repeat-containing protein [bacterium]MDB4401450.1 VCBS repeat-containing protein [bacterium]
MERLPQTSVAILPAVALLIASPGLAQTQFGETTIVEGEAASARDVFAADLNGDGFVDLLTASRADDTIAWYENLGGGVFSPRKTINANADGAQWVEAADFDNDGDLDVVSASALDDTVAWYENLGGGPVRRGRDPDRHRRQCPLRPRGGP